MNISNITDETIQSGQFRAYFALAGGGTDALADLLRTPGASRFVTGAVVPYSSQTMERFLDCIPERFCCAETAWKMAQKCFDILQNGSDAEEYSKSPLGVACTAALGTNRIKKGPCRAYIAMQTESEIYTFTVRFVSDSEESSDLSDSERFATVRAIQERIVSDVILCALNYVSLSQDDADFLPDYSLSDDDLPEFSVEINRRSIPSAWQDLLSGKTDALTVNLDEVNSASPSAILPGSFNPIHDGHKKMREIAQEILSCPVYYELSVLNADKAPVSLGELAWRVEQIQATDPTAPILLTRCPYFIDKARRFPGSTFVLGADTIQRLGDVVKYYQNMEEFHNTMKEFARLNTQFLVFGRPDKNNGFISLKELNLSETLQSLCREIPERDFSCSLSSTQIRLQSLQ